MNIKTKLSIQFSLMVVGILIFFSLLVYYFSLSSQLLKFRENLLEKARNTAILLIDVSEVDATLLKKIHQSTFLLEEEEIVIADSSLNVIYSNNEQYLLEDLTDLNANANDVSFFSIAEKDGVCFRRYSSWHMTGQELKNRLSSALSYYGVFSSAHCCQCSFHTSSQSGQSNLFHRSSKKSRR